MDIAIIVILAIGGLALIVSTIFNGKSKKKANQSKAEKELLEQEYYKLKILEMKNKKKGGDYEC